MEFFVIFLVFAASLWLAWTSSLRPALSLFALGLILSAALYLHHATEMLPVSL
jgi:Family of unknown function (DUF5993)